MAAPQIENIDSPSNTHHQQQLPSWNNLSSLQDIDGPKIDTFTKAWSRKYKSTSVGTDPSTPIACLHASSPCSLRRDSFICTDNLGFTPTVSAAALLSLEKDYQGNRNILLTNVSMASYLVINDFIKRFGKIKDILKKSNFTDMTMVILFHDIQEAVLCYSDLSRLLQQEIELCQVGLAFVDNAMVATSFDILLDDLQDTHLFVSLHGPFSQLVAFDYMDMLETIEHVRYFKELEFTESQISLVVEYSDTRSAVATQKLLHGKIHKGIIFNACLFKPENEPRLSLAVRQSAAGLQPIPENRDLYGTHHHSRFVSQDDMKSNTRSMTELTRNHWVFDTPPKLSLHIPHPSSSTSSSSASSYSSTSSLSSSSSATPSPTHSTFASQSFLRHASSSTTTKNTRVKHHHQQQKSHDNHSVDVPQHMSAHLLGPLIQEFSLASLDDSTDSTQGHHDTLTSLSTDNNKHISAYIPDRRHLEVASNHFVNRNDGTAKNTSQISNVFDLNRVINRLDRRTTFMIKNIPNKYDQAMLMEWVDATHKGTYDFLYLRIDFKNKCNVGYAFINFIDPESVIYFAQERQGKLWNRFNSEKICELAYAKIQGKASLIKKFQNSCVMEQEVAFRPKIFYSSGDHQGEEEPFPTPTRSDIKRNSFPQ